MRQDSQNSLALFALSMTLAFVVGIITPHSTSGKSPSLCIAVFQENDEQVDNEFRVWTDRRGQTVEAKFVELDGTTVKLETKDGKTIEISLIQLNQEGMRAATQMHAEKAFGNSRARNALGNGGLKDSSFGNREKGDRMFDRPGQSETEIDTSKYNLVEIDFGSVKPFETTSEKWNLRREPEMPTAEWDHQQSFSLVMQATHSDGVLIDARDPSRGFVRTSNTGDTAPGFLFDSKSGRTIGPIEFETPKTKVLAYDALRHRLLTSTSWSRKNRTIDIWKLTSNGVEHQFSFSPYPPSQKVKLTAQRAQFLDNERVAIAIGSQIGVFDLANKTALFGFKFDTMSRPQFSPDGKHMFGLLDNHIVALDLNQATVIGKSPVKLVTSTAKNREATQLFDISPDFTKAVSIRRRYLQIYDLASGELLEEFFLPTVRERQPVFLDNNNVFVQSIMGGSLVNIPLKSAIWNYSFCKFTIGPLGAKEIWSTADEFISFDGDNATNKFSASATPIPNEAASQVIGKLNLNDLIVLKPGDSVSLDLAQAQGGKAAIINQLETLGYKIDPNSPNKLRATVGQGNSETRQYRDAGSFSGGENVTLSTTHFELELIKNGETVWFIRGGSSSKDMGDFVILNEGETVQSLANAGKIGPAQFFSSIQLPEQFIRVPEKGFYGFSKGTVGGFEDE